MMMTDDCLEKDLRYLNTVKLMLIQTTFYLLKNKGRVRNSLRKMFPIFLIVFSGVFIFILDMSFAKKPVPSFDHSFMSASFLGSTLALSSQTILGKRKRDAGNPYNLSSQTILGKRKRDAGNPYNFFESCRKAIEINIYNDFKLYLSCLDNIGLKKIYLFMNQTPWDEKKRKLCSEAVKDNNIMALECFFNDETDKKEVSLFLFEMTVQIIDEEFKKNLEEKRRENRKKVMHFLIRESIGIRCPEHKRFSFLFFAIESEVSSDAIELIIKLGADPHEMITVGCSDHSGDINALFFAISRRCSEKIVEAVIKMSFLRSEKDQLSRILKLRYHKKIAKIFVEKYPIVSVNSHLIRKNKDPILYAIKCEASIKVLEILIRYGGSFDDKTGYALLLMAIAQKDSHEFVKLLIEAGADVNYRDADSGDGILFIAIAQKASPEVVNVLIKGGADVNCRNFNSGHSVIFIAIKQHFYELVKLLIKSGAKISDRDSNDAYNLLVRAIEEKYSYKTVYLLIKAGVNVNYRDANNGYKLLIRAIRNKSSYEVIDVLIKGGVDVNYKDDFGNNSLFIAIKCNSSYEIIKKLIEKGVDVNCRDDFGNTVLITAIYFQSSHEVVNALLQGGAEVNCRDDLGNTVLIKAIYSQSSYEVVNALIKGGSEVNCRDNFGNMALITAIYSQSSHEVVNALLQGGAVVNSIDNSGETPAVIALKESASCESLNLLIEAGAEVKYINPQTRQRLLSEIARRNTPDEIKIMQFFREKLEQLSSS